MCMFIAAYSTHTKPYLTFHLECYRGLRCMFVTDLVVISLYLMAMFCMYALFSGRVGGWNKWLN
jgi:hypothetical protein